MLQTLHMIGQCPTETKDYKTDAYCIICNDCFRLVVEMCKQNAWVFPLETVAKIAESFAILTFGSAFMHGSNTTLGRQQDVRSNDLFPYVIHQAAMSSIPYSPVIHDLSESPRMMSGEEMVDYWLDMFNNIPVSDWLEAMSLLDLPPLQTTFAGIFGNILLLTSDFNTTLTLTTQLMDMFGLTPEEKQFFLSAYLPAIAAAMEDVSLSGRDNILEIYEI